MEHFFLQRQHVNQALEANVSQTQKRTHDLSCTMHNSPLSRRQYFPSGIFPPPLLQQTTWSWKSFAPTWKSVLSEKHLLAIWKSGRPLCSQVPQDPLFFKFKRSFYEVEASKADLGLSLQFCKDCGSQLATLHGINFLRLSGKDIRSKLA